MCMLCTIAEANETAEHFLQYADERTESKGVSGAFFFDVFGNISNMQDTM